jgi:CRP-like cAMP-binding protein
MTDSMVAKMPATVFRKAVHDHPDVCDQLLRLLVSRVRMLANRVNEYTTFDVRRRIYAELLRLARKTRKDDVASFISPPPTHAELAARLSTHRSRASSIRWRRLDFWSGGKARSSSAIPSGWQNCSMTTNRNRIRLLA